jgi:protein-tyrosine phosphatase
MSKSAKKRSIKKSRRRSMSQHRNDADEIIPRLWLGNVRASQDEDFMRRENIDVIFNCTKDLPFLNEERRSTPKQYRVPVDDNLEEEEIRNMELWSPEIAHKLLTQYNNGHTILVHCYAGMQRSAACVAMLLIALKHMTAQEAMKYIKERRPVAFQPRANFGRAIHSFERDFFGRILPSINRSANRSLKHKESM